MKKKVVFVLCFALIMMSCIPAFAQEEKPVGEGQRIQLQISNEKSDLETMEKSDLSKFFLKDNKSNEKTTRHIFSSENYLELEISGSEKIKSTI